MRKLLILIPIIVLISCSKKDVVLKKSLAKDIISFSFDSLKPVIKASIDSNQNIIKVNFPVGLDIKKLSPTIVVSEKATVSPNSGVIQDFTEIVSYTVTAEDGSSKTYKVQANFNKSSAKDILNFSFKANSIVTNASIDSVNKTIKVILPKNTDLTRLIPTIVISEKATIIPNSGEVIDFSKPVTYKITAEDGTSHTYIASAEIEKDIINSNPTIFVADESTIYAIDVTDGNEKWRYAVNDSVESSPIFSNGLIFFGTGSSNGKNKAFLALNAITGDVKWKIDLKYAGIKCSPIAHNGIIYLGFEGTFYALDALSGKINWQTPISTENVGSASIFNNTIYFSNWAIHALNLSDGKEKWKIFPSNFSNTGSPVIANNLLYVGVETTRFGYNCNDDSEIRAYSLESGGIKWSIKVNSVNFTTLTEVDGEIFFTDNNFLYQVEKSTGAIIQKIKLSTTNECFQYLQIIDTMAYVVGSGNKLFAYDLKSQSQKWNFQDGLPFYPSFPTIVDDIIYLSNKNLTAINRKTGQSKWIFKYNGKRPMSFTSPCIVMSNGDVYRGLGNIHP